MRSRAIGKGLLKTISKMGISTIPSYCGAQIFEAVGLAPELVDRHFTGTPSRIGGIGLRELARGSARPPRARLPGRARRAAAGRRPLRVARATASTTSGTPRRSRCSSTRCAAAAGRRTSSTRSAVNDDAARRSTMRGLLRLPRARTPIPLDEVEPAAEIVKRFSTGAMSLGSLSREAHETLAIAMNRIGGRSNTGEGGEDPARFARRAPLEDQAGRLRPLRRQHRLPRQRRRAADQDGAGREARRGRPAARPQGRRVHRERSASRRRASGLISPPPHHDIYSIEDLKQLIYDLRCANPDARISVKLVAEVGVGTVAAGVAKANADHVLISGHDGGTGASPLSSILHAGIPWEIGLAETQQTLVLNDLRSRIWVQTDGQLKTGRDVVDRRAARRRRDGLRDRAADRDRLRDDARLPPQHVPGRRSRRRIRSCASASRASPSTSSTSSSSSPRRCAQIMARLGIAALRGSRRPRRPARGRRRDRRTGRRAAST